MPTKPASAFTFATTANYTVGARIGSPTKVAPIGTEGLIPGTNAAPEQLNFTLNNVGQWLSEWVLLGTFNPDADAHIVETDASGICRIAQGQFGATAPYVGGVLFVDSTNHTTPQAVSIISPAHSCLTMANNGASATMNAIQNGSGTCFNADAMGAGTCVDADSVDGVAVDAFSANNHAISGLAGSGGFAGVRGQSASAAASVGVFGESLDANSNGVLASNAIVGASPTASSDAALFATANEATAAFCRSVDGYGVFAENTGGDRSPIHLEPQAAKPTFTIQGDEWFNSSLGRKFVTSPTLAGGAAVHASEYGWSGGVSNTGSGNWGVAGEGTMCTLTADASQMPTTALRQVVLNLTVNLRNADATLHYVTLKIRDTTAGAIVLERTVYLQVNFNTVTGGGSHPDGYEKMISFRASYPVPAVGARNFTGTIEVDPIGGSGVDYDQAILTVEGAY